MVAVAPEARAETGSGWLDDFLADWQTGTGPARDVREPATGRHLMTINESTSRRNELACRATLCRTRTLSQDRRRPVIRDFWRPTFG